MLKGNVYLAQFVPRAIDTPKAPHLAKVIIYRQTFAIALLFLPENIAIVSVALLVSLPRLIHKRTSHKSTPSRAGYTPVTHNTPFPTKEPASAAELTANLQVADNADESTSPLAAQQTVAAPCVTISTEKRPARERRIFASVEITQPVDQVWKVITDYEQLADFIPSLSVSKVLGNTDGRIRLEQIGVQCFLKIKFCARVVLEMTESFPHKVGFSMQEGDFKQFQGAWHLKPTEDKKATILSYDLFVKPPRAMPTALIESHIRHNLTTNLLAIHQRTLTLAQ